MLAELFKGDKEDEEAEVKLELVIIEELIA